jgi:predicted XRE-type DNA-binding protein
MHASIDLSRVAKHLLATAGYTTKSLGAAVGLSQPSMSRLASGKTRDVSADVALRLIRLAGGTVHMPELAGTADAEPVASAEPVSGAA